MSDKVSFRLDTTVIDKQVAEILSYFPDNTPEEEIYETIEDLHGFVILGQPESSLRGGRVEIVYTPHFGSRYGELVGMLQEAAAAYNEEIAALRQVA